MTIKGYYFLTPCRLVEAPFNTSDQDDYGNFLFNIQLLDDDHVQSSSSHRHMDDNR